MRRRRIRSAAPALLLLAAVTIGCRWETERERVQPWLLEKSTYTQLGGFGGNTSTSYFTKHWGFWRRIDAWGATVIDGEHVLLFRVDGHAVLARGSLRATLVCETMRSVSLPPGPAAVDCVGPVFRDHRLVAVHWQRFDMRGRRSDEREVAAVGEGRIFAPPPRVFAYDDEANPYFLLMNADAASDFRVEPRDCALVSTRGEGAAWVGPPSLAFHECHQPGAWEEQVGRRLRAAGLERG